jgi:hypothetical protein
MSTTAKIFDKIMSNNIIQMVVTFHGGMVALGYEWGSKNHPVPRDASPDESANKQLATLFSDYAGPAGPGEPRYKVNQINSIVYSVDGGMEDWMYAAGWDKSHVRMDCIGSKRLKNRFLRAEEVINSSSPIHASFSRRFLRNSGTSKEVALSGNRALVFLVETSDAKSPPETKLGGSAEVLHSNGKENGHIPRNIRLGLMSIDLLEPYVCFSHVHLLSNASSGPANPSNSSSTSLFTRPSLNLTSPAHAFLHLRWYIGGARVVDKTFLTLSRAPSSGVSPFEMDFQQYFDLLPSDDVLDELLANKSVAKGTGIHGGIGTIPSSLGLSFGRNRHSPRLISPIFSGLSRWHAPDAKDESHIHEDISAFDEKDPLRPQSEYFFTVNLSRWFFHRNRKLSDPMALGAVSSFASSFFGSSPFSHNEETNAHSKSQRKLQPNDHPRRKLGSLFSSSASTSYLKGKYWILAWAVVDQEYGSVDQGYPAGLGPMSYYANIRTKSETRCETTGPEHRTCHGRRYWPSDFIELDVLEDGTIAYMKHVLDCASWSMPQSKGSVNSLAASKQVLNETIAPQEPMRQHLNKSPSSSFQSDVEESYSLEQFYMLFMLVLLGTVFVVWHLSSCWKRNRIYASVTSNKYLKLPTGFRTRKPVSPGSLSSSSSQASFSSLASSGPPSPIPPSFFPVPTVESVSAMIV